MLHWYCKATYNLGQIFFLKATYNLGRSASNLWCIRLGRPGLYKGFNEVAKKLSILKEVVISLNDLSKDSLESIGRDCPLLKSLKFKNKSHDENIKCEYVMMMPLLLQTPCLSYAFLWFLKTHSLMMGFSPLLMHALFLKIFFLIS